MKKRKKFISPFLRNELKKNGISLPKYSFLTRFKLAENKVRLEENCRLFKGNQLWSIGAFSYSHSSLATTVSVGRYCSIGSNVTLMGAEHPLNRFTTSSITYDDGIFPNVSKTLKTKPLNESPETVIGNDVWIADNVKIKNGVVIGDGAIVGANSVVTKNVPAYSVVVGVPARVKKYRFSDDIVEKLCQMNWWNYRWFDHPELDMDADIEDFINQFERLKTLGKLETFNPKESFI